MKANARAISARSDAAVTDIIKAIVFAGLVLLLGLAFLPEIANEVERAKDPDGNDSTAGNVTGASSAMLDLAIVIGAIGIVVVGLAALRIRG